MSFFRISTAPGGTICVTAAQNFALVAILAVEQFDDSRACRVSNRTDITRPWALDVHSRCVAALVKQDLARTYWDGLRWVARSAPLALEALKLTPSLAESVAIWSKWLREKNAHPDLKMSVREQAILDRAHAVRA